MKIRITVRGERLELRGEMDVVDQWELSTFAQSMEPYGLVIASTLGPVRDADALVDEILDENYAHDDTGHADGATGDIDYDRLRALIKHGIELARKER